MNQNDNNNPFADADLIFSYSRTQALEDGVLIDVSPTAREAGFPYPVALTAALWADIQAIPERCGWQDAQGRLWDVLTLARFALRTSQKRGPELLFTLEMPLGEATNYQVKLVRGQGDEGEAVLTLMCCEED